MLEDWFDVEGFLVFDGFDGFMVGFYWIKVYGGIVAIFEGEVILYGYEFIGEVYVVGVLFEY